MKHNTPYSIFLIIALVLLSIVDNGIPALFETLQVHLTVNKERLIELISWCSAGIVLGMLYFSTKINNQTFKIFNIGLLLLSIVSTVLVVADETNFLLVNIGRFLLGVSIGICSSMAWWFSFNKAKKPSFYNILIMSSRPISIALGVPAFYYLTKVINWRASYTLLTIIGPILILLFLQKDEKEDESIVRRKSVFDIYKSIFSNRRSALFYGALFTNAMGYLGFFVLIPFIKNLDMSLKNIFFMMGLVEIIGTLMAKIVNLNQNYPFRLSAFVLVFVPILLFFLNKANAIIYLLPIYLIAVRIYIVNIANMIPQTFDYLESKNVLAVCGSLIGVFAWFGLGIISYFFSKFLVNFNTNQGYLVLFILNLISISTLMRLRQKVLI